jgi:hypothetical protein
VSIQFFIYLRPFREERRCLEERRPRRCLVFFDVLDDDLRPLLRRVRLVVLRDLLPDLLPPRGLSENGDGVLARLGLLSGRTA